MATVCHPATGRVTASFAAVAKHYGVSVAICPPRRGQPQGRGGEGQPHRRATLVAHPGRRRHRRAGPGQRWTGGAPLRGDTRLRPTARRPGHGGHRGRRRAAGPAAGAVPGRPDRRRGPPRAQALVAFRGNRYSVPPELARAPVTVTHRLGATSIDLATSTRDRHRPPPPGRRPGPAPPSATPATSPRSNAPRWPRSPPPRRTAASSASHPAPPPGPPPTAPRTASHPHRPHQTRQPTATTDVVVDLARYAAAAQGRNTLR